MAGKTAQQRVFGDEAKIAAGRAAVSTRDAPGSTPQPPGIGEKSQGQRAQGGRVGLGNVRVT